MLRQKSVNYDVGAFVIGRQLAKKRTSQNLMQRGFFGPNASAHKRPFFRCHDYERVDVLPDITPEEVPLEDLTFSKYKVVQKLMELGMWESIKAKLTDTQKDFLYLAQDFRIKDPNFYAIYAQLQPSISNIEALLRECTLE